jgi:hypothetical protein
MSYRKTPQAPSAKRAQRACAEAIAEIQDRSPIPLPSYAISIHLGFAPDGAERLVCYIPSRNSARQHRVELRASELGFTQLLSILREQSASGAKRPLFATAGSPIQYDLDKMARAMLRAEHERQADAKSRLSAETKRRLLFAPEATIDDLI